MGKNHNELLLTLQRLYETQNEEYDVIALSETWIQQEQLHLFSIPNYRPYVAPRLDGRRSGGVIIYIREKLNVEYVRKINFEGANVLEVRINFTKAQSPSLMLKSVTLMLVYKDCARSKTKFISNLEQLIETSKDTGKMIIMGDININLLDCDDSSDYLNKYMANGFLSLHNQPTRGKSWLDHVFANIPVSMVTCKILDEQITDHALISISLVIGSNHVKETEVITKRKTDDKIFKENIKKVNWKWLDGIDNVNTSVNRDFEQLISTIQDCFDKSTKIKIYKPNNKLKKKQP